MTDKLNDLSEHSNITEWTDEIEEILKQTAEKSQIYRILHIECHNKFKRKYYYFTIPIIILSSLTGSANLALGSFSNENDNKFINLVIGILGIVITVISTLNNFFNFQSRKIEHYNSSKEWFRICRLIEIELSLQRLKRHNVNNFLHLILQEIERIHSSQPNIRTDVINNFLKKYKKKNIELNLPEIIKLKKIIIVRNTLEPNVAFAERNEYPSSSDSGIANEQSASIDSEDGLNIII